MPNRIKCVAFNVADPDQNALLQHALLRSSFSGYVKRLIQRDMEGGHLCEAPIENEKLPGSRELVEGLI